MKKYFLALFILCGFLYSSTLQSTNTLKANNKPVMLIFESKTCAYCDVLKKDFQKDEKMKELANKFNIYLIDKDKEQTYFVGEKNKEETTTTLRMAFAVKATPNIIMFDKNWNKIFQLPGYASPKQMNTFMAFVLGVQDGSYKIKDWQEYIKKSGI